MSAIGEYLARGSGDIEIRLVLEGCPLQFCTAHDMAAVLAGGTDEGWRRVGGLLREGLSFQESAYLPGAEYRSSVGGATIEDTDTSVAWNLRAASYAFSKVPRVVGYMRLGATAATTTFSVQDASLFTVGTVYHVNTEAVRVTARDTGADTLTVTRGMWATTAQAHFVAESTLVGDRTIVCPIFDAPPTYRRRRVWIYGHGNTTAAADVDGVLLARGVLSGPPQLSDGATWSLSIAPLTSILDEEIGPREGAMNLVGIYYPGATPFRVTMNRRAGAYSSSDFDTSISVYMAGVWRTQAEFCAELETALNAAAVTATWGERFAARPVGPGWELYVLTDATTARYISADNGGAVDGYFTGWLEDPGAGVTGTLSVGTATEYRCMWQGLTNPDAGYGTPLEGLRCVPRSASFAHRLPPGTAADVADFPWHAFYVAAAAGVAAGDTLRVDMPSAGEGGVAALSWEAVVESVNTTSGLVIWAPDTMRVVSPETGAVLGYSPLETWTIVTPAHLAAVMVLREYGLGGSVSTFLQDVWSDAPDNANAGTVPFILVGDFASAATLDAAVAEAAAGAPWLLHRRWSLAKPVRLLEIVQHELRLLGAYLATDANGAITIRPLTTRLDTDATIDTDDLVNDESFGELVTEPDGVISGLTVRTGYDPIEDDYKGVDLEVTALGALSIQRQRTPLEIAPKSRAAGAEPDAYEIIAHLYGTISLWSRHRFQVAIDVPATFYLTRIGDVVYCTIPQLPYDGERSIDGGGGGMIDIRGTVVGRMWRFADPVITLTVLFDSLDVAGYTPTGRVASASGSGTTTPTVTLEASEYGPGGSVADASFFSVGMRVRLMEWDDDAPTIILGVVTAQNNNDVTLLMDSVWTIGTSTWNLLFAQSDATGMTTAQLAYAFLARSDRRVYLASGTQDPKELAP